MYLSSSCGDSMSRSFLSSCLVIVCICHVFIGFCHFIRSFCSLLYIIFNMFHYIVPQICDSFTLFAATH